MKKEVIFYSGFSMEPPEQVELLDSSPKNLDHIKLMNNFFKFLNYKI